jgi:hypothetical protein
MHSPVSTQVRRRLLCSQCGVVARRERAAAKKERRRVDPDASGVNPEANREETE